MELYKLVNGALTQWHGGSIVVGAQVIANPDDGQLMAAGWMPLTTGDIPDFDVETELPVPSYTITDGCIIQTYTVEALPETAVTPAPSTLEERLAAVEADTLTAMLAIAEIYEAGQGVAE